jgi:hypothetical protein
MDSVAGKHGKDLLQDLIRIRLSGQVSVPEPATIIILLTIGIAGTAGYGWRRRRTSRGY